MRSTGEKLICYTSRKRSLLKNEIHSELNSSPRKKNATKIYFNRSCKFKPQSNMKSTGLRKCIQNSKKIENLHKISDRQSAKRSSSSKKLGKRSRNRKNASSEGATVIVDKRKRRQRKKKNVERDEASCLQGRVRYLLIKMKLEQNLIDAYCGDGWKGQSREKLRPEKELQRAEKQILKCKLSIRDTIRQLDLLSSVGSIGDSVMHPDGSVLHEHIFCAKCKSNETPSDNDIILCDGTCNCGFHQKCLEPPLKKIPPGDQGWLCKYCECKMEIIGAINAHLGTCFSVNGTWEDIFKEATRASDVEGKFNPDEDWPSEDSEDEDYHPERVENSNSLMCSEENWSYSDKSECDGRDSGSNQNANHRGKINFMDSTISIDSSEASDREITSYRRQRRDVDYKKLHDEMFGKDRNEYEQQSEDEEWGPLRKKRRKIESNACITVTDCTNEAGFSNVVPDEKNSQNRKKLFRIPANALEKLRQAFTENELPSRDVRENLSEQLGISFEKINKWFKNARYAALKIRKTQMVDQSDINGVTKSSDEVEPLDDSCSLPLSSLIRIPGKLRRILQRNSTKLRTISLRKKHESAADPLPSKKRQLLLQKLENLPVEKHAASASIKHQRKKFPSEEKSKKKEKTVCLVDEMTADEQLYSVELERVCNLEERIQELKKALRTREDGDHASSRTHSRNQRVIYVPVVEIKEKRR